MSLFVFSNHKNYLMVIIWRKFISFLIILQTQHIDDTCMTNNVVKYIFLFWYDEKYHSVLFWKAMPVLDPVMLPASPSNAITRWQRTLFRTSTEIYYYMVNSRFSITRTTCNTTLYDLHNPVWQPWRDASDKFVINSFSRIKNLSYHSYTL